MEIPLSEIFTPELGARPATYLDDVDTGTEAEISVLFRRDMADNFGEPRTANALPVIWAQTVEVPGIQVGSRIVVHYGYLTDEAGEVILDEAGEPIIAENEFTYCVTRFHADAFGITEIHVSLNTVT